MNNAPDLLADDGALYSGIGFLELYLLLQYIMSH